MNSLKFHNTSYHSQFITNPLSFQNITKRVPNNPSFTKKKQVSIKACNQGPTGEGNKPERKTFLSLAEAGLVDISGLDTHEKFLCRLTISSLNLLRVISEQENCSIEELNGGKICDWFLKDKLIREQSPQSAVLQWDNSDFQF